MKKLILAAFMMFIAYSTYAADPCANRQKICDLLEANNIKIEDVTTGGAVLMEGGEGTGAGGTLRINQVSLFITNAEVIWSDDIRRVVLSRDVPNPKVSDILYLVTTGKDVPGKSLKAFVVRKDVPGY